MQEMQEAWVQSLGREGPLGHEMATHSSFLPRKLHEKGIWWAIVHGVAKSWTQLSTHMHI